MAKQPGGMTVPTKSAPQPGRGPGRQSAALGSRSIRKGGPGAPKPVDPVNSRSGQPPVESPPPLEPSDKPGAPGAEPKLMPEAEAARKGGIMARVAPAPPGVLAENPDPRTYYQVGPAEDNSPLIKLTASKPSPKVDAALASPGIPGTDSEAKAAPKAAPKEEVENGE